MKRLFISLIAMGWAALPMAAFAETESASIQCIKSQTFFAAPDSPDHRKYAPDLDVKAIHLALDVTPDFKQRTIEATATLRFKTTLRPVRQIKLDAVNLTIHSVTATRPIQSYQVTDDQVVITFAEPIAPDQEGSVTISYFAEPTQGLYFRTPEMGYKEGDTHLFSQGEEILARHWYPCLDSPNQLFTSEVTCRVPEGMTAISNGRLLSETKDPATGLNVFHWSQTQPHANYLLTLAAGFFKKLEDKWRDLPLAFFTPPSEFEQAASSFKDTRDMMEFFEQETGVPYPWDKYDQVCVNDFVAGGMENTSATTLTDGTLFSTATENIRNSEGLIAHELAHQWFGDLVTCKDWSHIWLNEGFATYYETLYNLHKNGRDSMLYEMYARTREITGVPNDPNAIVRRTYDNPDEMFGYLSYPKGSWVLHMLRAQLGEELYRRCIKTYLERYRHQNVVTDNLRAVIEEITGRSFDQFFDQWLYHGRFPELEISYSWDDTLKLAKISVQQNQQVDQNVLLFSFPLTLRFKSRSGVQDQVVQITKRQEDFYFHLDAAPELVRVDPEYTLLAKTKFSPPRSMLAAQLADPADVIGRLLAVEFLASKADKEAVTQIQRLLNEDPFYGVRLEASRALRGLHSDAALAALLASTKQADARVRHQVVEDIGGFYTDQTREEALTVLKTEKNPAILAASIRQLGGYSSPDVRNQLETFLHSESYRNELADAAIAAMRLQDDPAYLPVLIEVLGKSESLFTTGGFAQGLEALAYLARNEEKKDDVREFLMGRLNHKKRSIQNAAISALGTLGDPKAIGALRTFATASKENPLRGPAERAVASLRAARKPVDDFKNLRQEVLDLQKNNRDLQKELGDLKKVVQAQESIHPTVNSRGSQAPVPGAPSRSKVPSPKASE